MIINHSPHDALFKAFFTDIAIARDFFDIHLSASLRKHCNFNTLALCSGSFIEPDLRHHCSDMLYSMRTRHGAGYIYCLVEHQSTPQRLMAYRLLRYSLAAMQQHLDQGHKQLPVVVPLLFYQGGRKGGYPYDNNWLSCFSHRELAHEIYTRPFPVIDLSAMPDDEIMTHKRVALLELVQKHIRLRDMALFVKDISRLMYRWRLSQALRKSLFTYIVRAGKTEATEGFIQALSQHTTLYREEDGMMTIAKQFELKGQQKGKREARLDMARQSLADGTDRSLVKKWTGLTDAELDCLVKT